MALLTTQEQKQTISTAMIQSLNLLAYPARELQEYLNELAMENPLMDLEEVYPQQEQQISLPISDAHVVHDWDDDPFQVWKGGRRDSLQETALSVEDNAVSEETLTEHLIHQLKQDRSLPEEYLPVCCFIVECLNSRGYLEESIEDLAAIMDISVYDAAQALYVVQSLTPTGVGARDLQECLVLQLAEGDDFNANTLAIVKNYLPLLASGNLQKIEKELGISKEEAERSCNAVRNLNPIPSRGFYSAQSNNRYIVPDAMVDEENGKLIVKYNDRVLPKVTINREYCKLLRESSDPDTQAYLQKNLRQAESVQQNLKSREATIIRVVDCILESQSLYLTGKSPTPDTLTINDVAEKLQLHASTVSRAVKEKYILYHGQTLRLKDLFHTPVRENITVSRPAVYKQIEHLIDSEDKAKPLSDEKIRKLLEQSGVEISRRTVAAYREELNIPCASARKR